MKTLFEYITESLSKTSVFTKRVESIGLENVVQLTWVRTKPVEYQVVVYTDSEEILKWVDKTMKEVFGFSTTKSIKELQDEFNSTKKSPHGGAILFAQFDANNIRK